MCDGVRRWAERVQLRRSSQCNVNKIHERYYMRNCGGLIEYIKKKHYKEETWERLGALSTSSNFYLNRKKQLSFDSRWILLFYLSFVLYIFCATTVNCESWVRGEWAQRLTDGLFFTMSCCCCLSNRLVEAKKQLSSESWSWCEAVKSSSFISRSKRGNIFHRYTRN